MTDLELNNLTHEVADLVEKAAGIEITDRYRVNDILAAFLAEYDVEVKED